MLKYHQDRGESEIEAKEDALMVILQAAYAVVAFTVDGYAYPVPLSCGYDAEKHSVYFHSSKSGKKMDMLRVNPKVSAVFVEDWGYIKGECGHTYRSVIVDGKMTEVTDDQEKIHGLTVLLNHLEDHPDAVKEKSEMMKPEMLERVAVLRLDINRMSAKQGK